MMLKKLEELLDDNPMLCAIAKGVVTTATIAFALMALVVLIVAAFVNVWWFLAFPPCAILTGATAGVGLYLCEEF